jgi:hypothetical protein
VCQRCLCKRDPRCRLCGRQFDALTGSNGSTHAGGEPRKRSFNSVLSPASASSCCREQVFPAMTGRSALRHKAAAHR